MNTPVMTSAPSAGAPADPGSLLSVIEDLDLLLVDKWTSRATIGDLDDALAGRSIGLLMILLSVPFVVPVPIPLLATVCGLPMVWIGLQMALGWSVVLPGFVRRRTLSGEALRRTVVGARRLAKPVAWLFGPRLDVMLWRVPARLTGVSIAVAAAVLSLPIPIPLANMIPAIALLHFAAGILQRDGLAVVAGHVLTATTIAYLYFIGDTAAALLQAWLG